MSPRAAGGFTLVELVLVTAIVAAGAAVAVPRYTRSLARARLDAAATQVATRILFAREAAAARSAEVFVVFDAAADRIVLQGLPDPAGRAGAGPLDLRADPLGANLRSHTFAEPSGLRFDAWGRPDAGGSIELSVGDLRRRVEVEPGTGVVRTF